MGYGIDEDIEFEEDDIYLDRPLSDFEKMLSYHELTKDDFSSLSNNQQSRFIWNYRRFDRGSTK